MVLYTQLSSGAFLGGLGGHVVFTLDLMGFSTLRLGVHCLCMAVLISCLFSLQIAAVIAYIRVFLTS